jgi:hypothetical protein
MDISIRDIHVMCVYVSVFECGLLQPGRLPGPHLFFQEQECDWD